MRKPSYEYCVNVAAQYVMMAQSSSDPERIDINLTKATTWIRKAREANRETMLAYEATLR